MSAGDGTLYTCTSSPWLDFSAILHRDRHPPQRSLYTTSTVSTLCHIPAGKHNTAPGSSKTEITSPFALLRLHSSGWPKRNSGCAKCEAFQLRLDRAWRLEVGRASTQRMRQVLFCSLHRLVAQINSKVLLKVLVPFSFVFRRAYKVFYFSSSQAYNGFAQRIVLPATKSSILQRG